MTYGGMEVLEERDGVKIITLQAFKHGRFEQYGAKYNENKLLSALYKWGTKYNAVYLQQLTKQKTSAESSKLNGVAFAKQQGLEAVILDI